MFMRKRLLAPIVSALLVTPAAMSAHGGHTHKVMGTVASVQGERVDVKSTDGKVVTVVVDAKTTITRDKTKLDAASLKTGERVSVDYMQEKGGNIAKSVKLGVTPAAPKK